MDTWGLIKNGRHPEAIESLTNKLCKQPSPRLYVNRGIAYMNVGQLHRAQDDFEAAERTDTTRGDSYRLRIGAVEWIRGMETEAEQTWESVVQDLNGNAITYTDAAGGVQAPCLLWFAGMRLENGRLCEIATESLKRTLKSKRTSIWPGIVGQLVLGRTVASSVRAAVSSVPILRERQLCQAEFYIAWCALQDHRRKDCWQALRRSAQLNAALLENEFYLARHELSRQEREDP
jgi:tetratricopeptide (TPR) repeat protein